MPQNYYIILGVPKHSSQEDIRAAYRRLAKKFHPDHYGKNQAPFQIIQEAYSVLSDPKSRKSYDHSLQSKSSGSTSLRHTSIKPYVNEDIEPLIPERDKRFSDVNSFNRSFHQQRSIFDDIFDGFAGGHQEAHDPGMTRPQDISVQISLSPLQAQRGGNVRIDLSIRFNCPVCYRYPGHGFACWRCNGTGILREEKPVRFRYPAGIRDNQAINLTLHTVDEGKIFLNAIFKIILYKV